MTPTHEDVRPLVVDLDGTLHADDLSWLIFRDAMIARPWLLVPALWRWFRLGKANMKCWLEERVQIDPERLTWHGDVIDFLQRRRESGDGPTLVLATGTPSRLASRCNDCLGKLFHEVIATTSTTNMIGENKARELIERYGEKGFDYVGNSRQDLHVWSHAQHVYVANPSSGVLNTLARRGISVTRSFHGKVGSVR